MTGFQIKLLTDQRDHWKELIDLGRLLRSFTCAFNGIYLAVKSEWNFRIHITAMVLAIAVGVYLGLDCVEWGLVIFAIGLVLAAELFNTAVEKLGDDAAGGRQSSSMKWVKDISAAAVLISAITALVIGIIILIVPFIQKIAGLF